MDQYLTPEEVAFRSEVRAFVRDNLPPALAAKSQAQTHLSRADVASWQAILFRQGWGAPSWPKEHGGPGWSLMQRIIFEEECAAAGAPALSPFGLSMVGPVIYTYGTPEQKARYLPKILSGEEFWCQGFSEPGAGSDLSGLSTRAVLDGDHYVVNGSKIWTSQAHQADMIFMLVRTDLQAKKQSGISFLLMDMKTPGITINPLISIDDGHSLNQTFYENVRVPRANLVGDENRGWNYAKFLLSHERKMSADIAGVKARLGLLKQVARGEQSAGQPLTDDPLFSFKMAGAEIEALALETTNFRLLLTAPDDERSMQAASMMKLRGSEVQQLLQELIVEGLGHNGLPYGQQEDGSHRPPSGPAYADGRVEDYLFRRAATIYAGSSETQRNILAKMLFGA
ncbi:MAG: acyl-CoA dehydrogenase family protein [Burkholderiales bacterium]